MTLDYCVSGVGGEKHVGMDVTLHYCVPCNIVCVAAGLRDMLVVMV